MDQIIELYGPLTLALAFGVMLLAGFTKGVIGFALPMIAISGLGSVMSVETAIAALILPTLVSNLMQSARNGLSAAWDSFLQFWRLNLALFGMIAICAQLVVVLSDATLFTLLGVMVSSFGLLQLMGWRPRFAAVWKNTVEVLTGLVAGFFGGISGVWGPPILVYFIASDVPKVEMVRVQGISYLIGSVVLLGAHLRSGVFDETSGSLSALMLVPAIGGMLLGQRVQDRLDQVVFRKVVLGVLVLAGLNLLRRGLLG